MRDTIDFGIDLGTTNSAIAVADEGGVKVIKNNDGWDYTPSAVWLPTADLVKIGRPARERAISDPDNTALEFKLDMGLADVRRDFPAAGRSLTPPELSAEVLKSLRLDVRSERGELPEAAVITVPAKFALNQTDATRDAARLAGFAFECPLIQEPTAAAFAYGVADASERAAWLVFDLGGGTFDAAVVTKRDGELQVLNHAGDPYLGGKLIDWAVIDRLLVPALERDLGLSGVRRDDPRWRKLFARLKPAAENAKIELSKTDASLVLVDLPDVDGVDQTFTYTLTRDALDGVAEPFYLKAIANARDALAESEYGRDDIDRVLLVGGPTLAPGLRERLADPDAGLGIELDHGLDPTTVVASGAAMFASTRKIPRRLPAPQAGEYTVRLGYPASTPDRRVPVAGRFETAEPTDWGGFSVVLSNPGAVSPFQSPQIAVQPDGTFETEVVIDARVTSRFTLTLSDPDGRPQRVTPDSFSITHSPVEVGGPVLTQSLGIKTDGGGFDRLLAKNATLAASVRRTYRTPRALRRNDVGVAIRIPVLEGERPQADRNREVGVLEVRPKDLRFDLPADSEVEVTLDMDESRIVTVTAYLPVGDVQCEAEIDVKAITTPGADVLADEVRALERRLAEMRGSAEVTSSPEARRELEQVEARGDLERVREQADAGRSDPGAAAAAEQGVRELNGVLDDIEGLTRMDALLDKIAEALRDCDTHMTRYGTSDDRAELAELKAVHAKLRGSQDVAAVERLEERVQRLLVGLYARRPDWDLQVFEYFKSIRHQLSPRDRADAAFRDGERAVASGDRRALAAALERLRQLLPDDAPSPATGEIYLRRDG